MRTIVTVLSGLLIALFVVLFALPVHATPPGGTSVACGNGWTIADAPQLPEVPGASFAPVETRDSARACDRARAVRKSFGVAAAGLGVAGLCGVYLSRRVGRANKRLPQS